jgi:hypothetical protein
MCDPKWGREAQKNAENDPPLQYQQQPQIQMRFGVQVPNQQFNLVPITPTQSQSQSQTQTQTQTQTQSNWVYKGPSIHTFGFGSDHSADLLKYFFFFNFPFHTTQLSQLQSNPFHSLILSFFHSLIL